uniref:STE20 related adaptor beta n=1 Tax=Nothoprocta perdicaria TaxID=30464 RepID=A0A8C6ZCC8_NOTPE
YQQLLVIADAFSQVIAYFSKYLLMLTKGATSVSGRRFNNLTSIYLARHTPTGMQVAVRITDLESCSEEHLKALQNEVVLSHFFQHPNIMTLWTVFTAGSWLWVISPFMAYGSARHLLKTYFPEGMSEALIGNILFGTIRGLNYMHQNGYIHSLLRAQLPFKFKHLLDFVILLSIRCCCKS